MNNTSAAVAVPGLMAQPSPRYDSAMFIQRIQEAGRRAAGRGGKRLHILEAGCGRRWSLGDLGLQDVRPHITGVDSNAESLRMRIEEAADLHQAIVGDLRTVRLPPERYDVVFCSWVLEHIAGAEAVLDRLAAALRPGGYLLVRIPDRYSVYGFLTRYTPFPLHVAYKRYIRGQSGAGKPGHGPFPTAYDPVVSYKGMLGFCERRGLTVAAAYSCNFHLQYFGRAARTVDLGLRTIAALSLGRLTADYSNLAFVLHKPEG